MDKKAQLSLEHLKQQIQAIDPTLEEEDPGLKHAIVLLSSVMVGTDSQVLAQFTGYSMEFINQIALRLQAAGIWHGNNVDSSDWLEKGSPGLGLDVLVAKGEISRKTVAPNQWSYGPGGNHGQ